MEIYLGCLLLLLQVGCIESMTLRETLRSSPTYVSEVEDTIYRMADRNNDGALSTSDVQRFLGTPYLSEEIKKAFSMDARRQADSNNNGLLERYEVQRILASLIQKTDFPSFAFLNLMFAEAKSLIAKGDIPLPQNGEEKADLTLTLLDTNNNGLLSEDEMGSFYSIILPDIMWRMVLEEVEIADADDDEQLNRSELVNFYEEVGPRFTDMSLPSLITYSRVLDLIGTFPDTSK